jgi:hypothetical protein
MKVRCACGTKAEDALARLCASGWVPARLKDGWVCAKCALDATLETRRDAFDDLARSGPERAKAPPR